MGGGGGGRSLPTQCQSHAPACSTFSTRPPSSHATPPPPPIHTPHTPQPPSLWCVLQVLGQGSFGKVRLAWHRLAGAKVAIKSYEKAKLKEPNHWRRVQQEIGCGSRHLSLMLMAVLCLKPSSVGLLGLVVDGVLPVGLYMVLSSSG